MHEWRGLRARLAQLEKGSRSKPESVAAAPLPDDRHDQDHYRLHLYKIDQLPAAVARAHLKDVCRQLRLSSVERLSRTLESMQQQAAAAAEVRGHLREMQDALGVAARVPTPDGKDRALADEFNMPAMAHAARSLAQQLEDTAGREQHFKAFWEVAIKHFPEPPSDLDLSSEDVTSTMVDRFWTRFKLSHAELCDRLEHALAEPAPVAEPVCPGVCQHARVVEQLVAALQVASPDGLVPAVVHLCGLAETRRKKKRRTRKHE